MSSVNITQSITVKAARFVIRDVLFDLIRWPVWWYTRGTVNTTLFVWQEFLAVVDRLSLRILFRNLLKPMYGDYSRSGRVISLVMRLIVFAFRLVGLTIWTVVLALALLLWLAIIPLTVYQIVVQIVT
ncbi:MAG: hypothetical protein HY420_01405 [Candidatus Kerfeldbacteria bacterium]|nr:hypothetical protein [Candidatus Kerfeldbacteria bacterium]